jgi:hypothetical protein
MHGPMLSLHNIHPLTDFKRNVSTYIEQVCKTSRSLRNTLSDTINSFDDAAG